MSLVVLLGALGAAVAAARARASVVFAIIVAETFLFPSVLLVPGASTGLLTVHRLVLVGALVGTARAVRRGSLPADAFVPTVLHLALLLYAFVTLVFGVLLAGEGIGLSVALHRWLMVVDAAVFFVVVAAHLRGRPDLVRAARLPVLVVTAVLGIALFERMTGSSYGATIARWAGQPERAFALETRAGAPRVRASAEFALALGWIIVLVLPLLLVTASRLRSWRWTVPVVLAAPALASTYARSAYGGAVAVTLFLVVVGALSAPVVARLLIGVWLMLPVLATTEVIDLAFRSESAADATDARLERLPLVFDLVAGRPFTGLGFTGLEAGASLGTTDSAFLLLYAETGVIGLVALVLVLIAAIASVAPGAAAREASLRGLAVGGIVATLAMVVASLSFDTLSGPQALRPYLLVVAFGVVAAERSRGGRPDPLARGISSRRLTLFSVAFLVGVGIATAAPSAHVREYRFTVAGAGAEGWPGDFGGRVLVNTLCDHAEVQADDLDLRVQCHQDRSTRSVDVGRLRVAGEDLASRSATLEERLRQVQPATRFHPVREDVDAIPAGFRTAPVWLPLLVGGLLFLMPRSAAADHSDHEVEVPVGS